MATHDYVIDNSTGANVRADLNNALQAIVTNNSTGDIANLPATFPFMLVADTTAGTMKIRNAANNAFIELFQLDGTLTLENGSASTPALAFRTDVDTGIFRSDENKFNVATGGVERMELGTTTIFNETGADVDFRIEGDDEQNLFYVDASTDRIGIGNSSPQGQLHIGASNNTNHEAMIILNNGGATGQEAGIEWRYENGTTPRAKIHLNSSGQDLTFSTADSSAMTIDSSQNVGIGTSNPSCLLTLHRTSTTGYDTTDTDNDSTVMIENEGAAGHSTIEFRVLSGGAGQTGQATISALSEAASSKATALSFGTRNAAGTLAERVRILSSGGITFNGDTSTDNALDDYEEGTWTPTFQNVSAPTYTSRAGKYTKIGRFVYLTGEIFVASGLDTGDASAIAIGALPFTPAATHNAALFEFGADVSLITQSGLEGFVNVNISTGSLIALLRGANNLAYSQCNSSGNLKFALSYETAT